MAEALRCIGGPLDETHVVPVGRSIVVPYKTDYRLPEWAIMAKVSCDLQGIAYPDWLNDELAKEWGEWRYELDRDGDEMVWRFEENK